MRQASMFDTTPPEPRADDDPECERDLFGNPIKRTGPAAPTYRPRKPAQQSLDLSPGMFTLNGGK